MSTALHILADHENAVKWRVALKYMRTPPTNYFVKFSGQAAYIELTLTRAILVTCKFHNKLVHVLAPSRYPKY